MKATILHTQSGTTPRIDGAMVRCRPAFTLSMALMLFLPRANAQTCDAPIPLPLSPARPALSLSTCSEGEPIPLHLCEGTVVTDSPFVVFNLTVVAGNTASLMAIGQTMQPYFYLTGPGCDGGACIQGNGYLALSDVPPGDYSLVVTSSPLDAAASCGPVSLMLDGDLASADVVFVGSFD